MYAVGGWPRLTSRTRKVPRGSPAACQGVATRGVKKIGKYIIEGSLEVKLPTIWTDEKQSRAEAERRERLEERRVEEKE